MAKKIKLAWSELNPAMFPKDVQDAVKAVHVATSALTAKFKALPEYKTQQAAIAAADALIRPYAPRIQVPAADGAMHPLVKPGEELALAYRYEKLSAASAPAKKASKANTILA